MRNHEFLKAKNLNIGRKRHVYAGNDSHPGLDLGIRMDLGIKMDQLLTFCSKNSRSKFAV